MIGDVRQIEQDRSTATASNSKSGAGEGVDRPIERKFWHPRRIALIAGVLLLVGLIGYSFASTMGGKRLNVEREKITIATVEQGLFQEFIAVSGTIMPRTTVYLDAVEGGRVEEVFVGEGEMVAEGDPLLRLSNNDLQLRLLTNEANLAEQVTNLEVMRFQIEQARLSVRQQLIQMRYEIERLERRYKRFEQLYDKQLVAQQDFEEVDAEYDYWLRRRELTQQSFTQDSLAQATRLDQMQESVDRMRRNFAVMQENLQNLTVRAPISGHLTALAADVGEILSRGTRLGQLDVLDGGYKVRAAIDEYYISRVVRGQEATTQPISGREYRVEVARVYPEVRDGRFEVDLEFVDDVPDALRRGQTIRLDLELGGPAEAVVIPRGGFYQSTGGNWIFVVDSEDGIAEKRYIRLGRQNPKNYEVVEGLEPGDRVVTSSYETFGEADRLMLH